MEINETGYMYCETYNLEEEEVCQIIEKEISKLEPDKNYNLKINVVKNKKGDNLGYSYIWIDNISLYNALIGNNLDGSKRIERIEEESGDFIELSLGNKSWGEIALQEESKIRFEKLEPLIIFQTLKISKEDAIRFKVNSENLPFCLKEACIFKNFDLKNSLYALKIPKWLTENKIKKFFLQFEKDKLEHHKNKKKFTYPIVEVKKSTANITFSNLNPDTASFVFNMTRRVEFKEGETKKCLIHFYQSKKNFK